MATPGPSPSKLVEDSDTAASPRPLGNQQALEMEDVIEFVEPLPNDLQCPLCLEFLKEPTLTSCGHHFCRECIDCAVTRSHVCPLCNDQGFQTFLNKEKQRVIGTLKIYCKRKSQGCEWVGELGRLEHHLDVEEGDCGCVEVECEFGPVGCVAKLPRKDLQRHKEENVHKHLVLMSVMSLKSNEAFIKKLQEQRVEFQQQQVEFQKQLEQQQEGFQQQLELKDEEIQGIQQSLQQQVEVAQELGSQLQQKDQQIADIRDQLLQRGEQIATIQQIMEGKQQAIERQLKGEAERLAQVEVKLTENAQQFVKMEGRLQDKDQQQVMYERKSEKRLGDVERKQQEGKHEVGRRLAEVEQEAQEAKTQSKTNEKRLDDTERKQREEKLEMNRRLTEVEKVEEKAVELQEVQTQFQRDNNQMDEEMAGLRRRIEQVETSLAEGQGQSKNANEKALKLEKQLVTFIPPPDFNMTDFEQHQKDDGESDWRSPPFYSHIGGYKMCLRVRAKGQDQGMGTHVSTYVHLMRGEHDDHLKWPFRGDITVSVLNQREEEDHVVMTTHMDDRTSDACSGRVIGRERNVVGKGIGTFIAHSALGYNSAKSTEYLRNDCLQFRVTNVKLTNF